MNLLWHCFFCCMVCCKHFVLPFNYLRSALTTFNYFNYHKYSELEIDERLEVGGDKLVEGEGQKNAAGSHEP